MSHVVFFTREVDLIDTSDWIRLINCIIKKTFKTCLQKIYMLFKTLILFKTCSHKMNKLFKIKNEINLLTELVYKRWIRFVKKE